MGLFDELVSDVASAATAGGGSGGGFSGGRGPPPDVPPPWQARWDSDDGRWFFVNEETGERRWDAEGLQVGEWVLFSFFFFFFGVSSAFVGGGGGRGFCGEDCWSLRVGLTSG